MSLTNLEMMSQMFALQSGFNAVVGSDKSVNTWQWRLASLVELGEAADHNGYKWWKSQDPNLAAVRMELVDILHFVISDSILNGINPSTAVDACTRNEELRNFESIDHAFVVAFRQLTGDALDQWSGLRIICDMFSMSLSDLYQSYVKKNVLNLVRQMFGYKNKNAHYVKVDENGIEDNELLDLVEVDTFENTLKTVISMYVQSRIPTQIGFIRNSDPCISDEEILSMFHPDVHPIMNEYYN